MTDAWQRYQKKWTDLSLRELANFATWMNRNIGHHPTIIGGWAVYMYNPGGMGSRDIDVLLPSRKIKEKVVNLYVVSNGYELRQRAFGEDEWIKRMEPGNPESETYLDVCTLQDSNTVHGKDVEIPWSIATRWQNREEIGGADIFIPAPEPLLILKAKAAWDRSYDIEKTGGDSFLRDKLRKDRFDVLSLLSQCEINKSIIDEIVSKYGFKECFKDVLERAVSDNDALERRNFSKAEIKNLRAKISEMLEGDAD